MYEWPTTQPRSDAAHQTCNRLKKKNEMCTDTLVSFCQTTKCIECCLISRENSMNTLSILFVPSNAKNVILAVIDGTLNLICNDTNDVNENKNKKTSKITTSVTINITW